MKETVAMSLVVAGMVISADSLAWWMQENISLDAAHYTRLVLCAIFILVGFYFTLKVSNER